MIVVKCVYFTVVWKQFTEIVEFARSKSQPIALKDVLHHFCKRPAERDSDIPFGLHQMEYYTKPSASQKTGQIKTTGSLLIAWQWQWRGVPHIIKLHPWRGFLHEALRCEMSPRDDYQRHVEPERFSQIHWRSIIIIIIIIAAVSYWHNSWGICHSNERINEPWIESEDVIDAQE